MRLGDLTRETPKALIDINGKTLLERQIIALQKNDINDIIVVTGPNSDKFEIKEVLYDTIGFFLKIKDDYVVLAYNKENDKETYKGTAMIPCSLVTDIRRLTDGYE